MAERAQELLAGSGWLPEPLRTPGQVLPTHAEPTDPEPDGEATAADGGEPAMADDEVLAEDEPVAEDQHAIAAE